MFLTILTRIRGLCYEEFSLRFVKMPKLGGHRRYYTQILIHKTEASIHACRIEANESIDVECIVINRATQCAAFYF